MQQIQISVQMLKRVIAHLNNFISNSCRPNPKYTKNKAQEEAFYLRNKTVINLEILMIFFFILNLLRGQTSLFNSILAISCCITIILFLFLTCRLHPEVFNISYNIIVAAYGPNVVTGHICGVYGAWLGTLTFPIFVLLFTGSKIHFILQGILQILFLNTIYQPKMKTAVEEMSPEMFVYSFSRTSNVMIVLNIVFVMCFQIFLQKAYTKLMDTEKKREELERQKIFLLSFSHELRNLINSLMGNVKLASLENIGTKAKSFLQNADLCGELLVHLVNNILDTGKVEVGDLEINSSIVDIYETIEKIWGVCFELIRRKDLRGVLRVQSHLPRMLKIDHYRLTQILLNLVGNAVKFTERGCIDLNMEWIDGESRVTNKNFIPHPFCEDEESELNEGMFEKNQNISKIDGSMLSLNLLKKKTSDENATTTKKKGILRIVVTDTGCGMSKESLKHIFKKFSQVNRDVSKRNLGTGLGLFITRELCERMGGQIRVYSKEDKGSCFIICIPTEVADDNPQVRIRTCSMMAMTIQARLKAIIVDDMELNRNIFRGLFDRLNIETIDTAQDGQEAFEKYKDLISRGNNLDLIILDIDITDGKTSVEKIREFETRNGLKPCTIIMMSGNCSETEIAEYLSKKGKIRADRFLKKPISLNQLSDAVSQNYKDKRKKSIPSF